MKHQFLHHDTTHRWFNTVASLAMATLLAVPACAQDTPAKPVNLKATQENGYVTLSWERLLKENADTLLTEGFEGDAFPEGWTVQTTNTYDPTYTWFHFPTPEMEGGDEDDWLDQWRHSGKGSAVVVFDQVGEHDDETAADQDEWLIMPATKGARFLNFYTYINPMVLEYGDYEEFPDHYYVKVSHDGGNTWEVVWDARYDSDGSDDWQLVSLYLGEDTSENGPIVAFHALSDLDDETLGLYFTWAIDDVSLYTEAANAPATTKRHASIGKTLSALPTYRPFDTTGKKKAARPARRSHKAAPGASAYNILLDGEVLAENVKSTSYTDKSEKVPGMHVYGVQGVNGDAVSETAEVSIDVAAPLTNAPRNVSVVPSFDEETGKYKVLMTWDAPEGERQPSHYECYANGALFAGWVNPEEHATEQTGVNRGVQYYAVKAVYENPDGESELVGDLVAIGTRNTVSNLKADIDEETATASLSWNAPKASEYEVKEYIVYRGGEKLGKTSTTNFTDRNIPAGTYEYNVKTVYTDGVVSLPMAVEVSYGEEPVYGLPFAENFNNGLKPADWTVERINASMKTDYVWRFDNWYELPVSGGGFEGNFASICSSISPLVNMFAALESPAILAQPTEEEQTFLEFDLDFCTVEKATGQKSEGGLRYSYNKEDWADLCPNFEGYHVEDLAEGETCKPEHIAIDITSCFETGEPIYLAWFYNAKKAHHIAIDNVKIYNVNATGITTVKDSDGNADAPVYNLNGQRVANSLNGLANGVYIRNGKKVVVK